MHLYVWLAINLLATLLFLWWIGTHIYRNRHAKLRALRMSISSLVLAVAGFYLSVIALNEAMRLPRSIAEPLAGNNWELERLFRDLDLEERISLSLVVVVCFGLAQLLVVKIPRTAKPVVEVPLLAGGFIVYSYVRWHFFWPDR